MPRGGIGWRRTTVFSKRRTRLRRYALAAVRLPKPSLSMDAVRCHPVASQKPRRHPCCCPCFPYVTPGWSSSPPFGIRALPSCAPQRPQRIALIPIDLSQQRPVVRPVGRSACSSRTFLYWQPPSQTRRRPPRVSPVDHTSSQTCPLIAVQCVTLATAQGAARSPGRRPPGLPHAARAFHRHSPASSTSPPGPISEVRRCLGFANARIAC